MKASISTIKTFILLPFVLVLAFLYYQFLHYNRTPQCIQYSVISVPSKTPPNASSSSSNVQIIDLNQPVEQTFKCIRTKTLLNYISTIVCLHNVTNDIYVSGSFHEASSIWEEGSVVRILQLLLRNPHLDFIDIGANIGTYTMYVAALGRTTFAIDCFEPNIRRVQRAIQMMNVQSRVILIHNAIFTQTGQILRLSNDAKNIGGQEVNTSPNENRTEKTDPYLVRTIKFDELEPILKARGVRGAIMKVDIEGSESFVLESGSQIFDKFDIPYVQMEWLKVGLIPERVKVIVEFFSSRSYVPMTFQCAVLNQTQHSTWPSDFFWVKKNASSIC